MKKTINFSSAHWRKSSHSGGASGQCVEVAQACGLIGIRDSKDPDTGHLTIEQGAFAGLVARAKAGTLDL
ncbi:DUF397 domain-containing protein [Actinomadura chokoriensis]|uniref:DUF397 domain-containing protein n=1 Tax=Actinomadura chokoriensis TaxID=454156 RepID=A0ABV4R4S4_9ACTN